MRLSNNSLGPVTSGNVDIGAVAFWSSQQAKVALLKRKSRLLLHCIGGCWLPDSVPLDLLQSKWREVTAGADKGGINGSQEDTASALFCFSLYLCCPWSVSQTNTARSHCLIYSSLALFFLVSLIISLLKQIKMCQSCLILIVPRPRID
jgi:hypothetical protein